MKYGNKVLFTFDSVINTELGILKLIKKEYNNPDIMDKNIIKNTDLFFRLLLLSEFETNPINLVIKKDKSDLSDHILLSFMKNKYNEVLQLSEKTGIYTLVINYMRAADGVIQVIILCKNEQEEQYIKQLNSDISCMVEDIEKINIKSFDSIFVKNINDLLLFKNLEGKNLFILNYRNNFEKDDSTKLCIDVFKDVASNNLFSIVDPYPDLITPLG